MQNRWMEMRFTNLKEVCLHSSKDGIQRRTCKFTGKNWELELRGVPNGSFGLCCSRLLISLLSFSFPSLLLERCFGFLGRGVSIKWLHYINLCLYVRRPTFRGRFSAFHSFVKKWIWFWLFMWILFHSILSIWVLEIQSRETKRSFASPYMPTDTSSCRRRQSRVTTTL